jgi:hypothetical protein
MTIIRSAYETTALQGYQTRAVTTALGPAVINGAVHYEADFNLPIMQVEGGSSFSDAIPPFKHPIVASYQSLNIPQIPGYADKSDWNTVVDYRPMGRVNPQTGKFDIRDESQYKLMQVRARLGAIWANDGARYMRDFPVAMGVFAAWISEQASGKFGLSPIEQMKLSILTAVYYASMFEADFRPDEREKTRLAGVIKAATGTKVEEILPILDQIESLNGVNEYLGMAAEVTGSVRLKEFNLAVLHGLVFGTWYGGADAKELIAVALEHPPTWLAVLCAAFTDRTFHEARLSRLVQRNSYRNEGKNFVNAAKRLAQV